MKNVVKLQDANLWVIDQNNCWSENRTNNRHSSNQKNHMKCLRILNYPNNVMMSDYSRSHMFHYCEYIH